MTHPDAQRAFEEYWTEDGRNLCKSPLDSVEARMHKRTWDAATERAAKAADTEREQFVELAAQNSGRESDFAFGSMNSAERIATAIRGTK